MKYITIIYAMLVIILISNVAYVKAQYTAPPSTQENLLYHDSEQWIRERAKYFFEQRAYPLGYIPDGIREAAWHQTKLMQTYNPPATLSKNMRASSTSWTLIGPVNSGGRITGIAIDPSNSQNVYFTAADGGVWKSTNGGSSFTPMADDLPTMAMGSIAIDPQNPNVIYVGTGEANFSGDSYPGIGVIKSTDGGVTWNISGSKFSSNIGRIAVHPKNSSIVLASSRDGIYRSAEAGVGWTRVQTGTSNDISINPANPNIMYAGVQNVGIVKSTDAGLTWIKLSNGAPKDSVGRISLDICTGTPNIIYAVVVRSSGGSLLAVFKSTDDGASWVRTATSPNFFGTQGWYDVTLAVNPKNPNQVFIGGIGLYMSSNGGYNWSARSGVHVDQHAFEFDSTNTSVMFAGNDGGIYKSTTSGSTFIDLNGNIPITQFYELGVAEQNYKLMYGGTQDNGSKRGTGTTNWTSATGGDGAYCVIDYTNSNIVYTEYQNGSHMKSTNGGSFFSINKGLYGNGPWVTPVVMHPTDPNILFTSTTKQLYKTTNGGQLWFAFNGNMDSTYTVGTIAISSVNPQVMVVGKSTGKVWTTANGGASWTNVSTGLPTKTCTEVAIDPVNPAIFYATFSSSGGRHVYRSTNSGAAWTDITNNLPDLPTNCIAINPYQTNILYVGTDFGVYISENTGASWQTLMTGMPKVVVVDLDLHKSAGVLRAATHGRSIYELAVAVGVELTAFSGHVNGEDFLLEWRTATETNNRGFTLERKIDSEDVWTEIAFVDGHGTAGYANFYSYRDPLKSIPSGAQKISYRLKQINTDGTFEYFPEIVMNQIKPENQNLSLDQNYPNPFGAAARANNPITTIRYSIPTNSHVQLIVVDMMGREIVRLIDEYKLTGNYVAHFDASQLPGGGYFYHLISNGSRLTKTMLYLK